MLNMRGQHEARRGCRKGGSARQRSGWFETNFEFLEQEKDIVSTLD